MVLDFRWTSAEADICTVFCIMIGKLICQIILVVSCKTVSS